jgi:hypothetical protein
MIIFLHDRLEVRYRLVELVRLNHEGTLGGEAPYSADEEGAGT